MAVRVLHLVIALGPGGIEKWLMSMLKMADRSRVAMDFCCWGPIVGPDADYCRSFGAEILHCKLKPTQIGFITCLKDVLKKNNYDIVHNHMQLYSGLGVWISKKCNIPVVTSFHNTAFPPILIPNFLILHKVRKLYGHISIKYALRNSDLVTGCSEVVLSSLEQNFHVKAKRKKVLYYGVELNALADMQQKQEFRNELGLSKDKILITHVGNMRPQKNHEGLIRIAAEVIAKDSKAHFILVGDGFLRPIIEEMIHSRQLNNNFSLLGFRSDIARILTCSDIFLFPSHWEGLGLVILEAMAAGLPVIASDLPVFRETVTDGVTGILWPVRDESGMAEKIVELMVRPDKRFLMGAMGREKVTKEFSLHQSSETLWNLYESFSNH